MFRSRVKSVKGRESGFFGSLRVAAPAFWRGRELLVGKSLILGGEENIFYFSPFTYRCI